LSARKLMETVFWDRKRVLMVGFMEQGVTTTSEVYFARNTKKRTLCRAIQNKRWEMLTYCIVFLHNDANPHTVPRTRALLGVV
jgi:hypothetical protein